LGDAYLADAWGTLLALEFAVVAAAACMHMDLIAADRVVAEEEGRLSEIYFCYSESWGFARGFAAVVVVAAAVHMEVIAADRVVVEDEMGHPFDVYSCHYLTSWTLR
jgi:hypothetical protein